MQRQFIVSSPTSSQLSPRILAAYERLEGALSHLTEVVDSQSKKVDASELKTLENKIAGLNQDNLALSEALEAFTEIDTDAQFEKLNDQIDALRDENEQLRGQKEKLRDMKNDFSTRIEKLIGNVKQVLEEE
jgi:chromosome segregation ATPase